MQTDKLIIGLAGCLISQAAIALPATTKEHSVACRTKSQIEDMTSFRAADDRASFNAYLNSGKCIVIKGGRKVTVTDSPGFMGGYAGFVYKGVKLWTTRGGLEYGD